MCSSLCAAVEERMAPGCGRETSKSGALGSRLRSRAEAGLCSVQKMAMERMAMEDG